MAETGRDQIRDKMVKVISAHHFSCQDIQTCEEPLAATTAPNDLLLLALGNHMVEVRDLNQGANVLFSFPTVDQVVSIVHCSTGNYVATIEAKKSRQGKDPTFARIYTNWDSDTNNQPMRARIAGRVTPSSQSNTNTLEMIELPLKKQPVTLACCQNNGNVIVACKKILYLYQLCLKVHEISKIRFLDFEECLMLDVGFAPTQVALFEDTVGCLSSENVHVFRVIIQENLDGSSGASVSVADVKGSKKVDAEKRSLQPKTSDLSDHIEWNTNVKNFPHGITSDLRERLKTKLHSNSFPPLVNLPSIQEQNRKALGSTKTFHETFGPFSNNPVSVKLYGTASLGTHGKVLVADTSSIFHLQFPTVDAGPKEEFHALAFKPALWPKSDEKDLQRRRKMALTQGFLHSSRYAKLSGITWLVATRQEGYLYHVPTHVLPEEIPDKVFCMAIYPFTSSVSRIALESYILHALTETGLETYTLRDAHYASKDIDVAEASFVGKDPICLIGLRPFFGVEHLLVSESHLVLLACSEGSSSSSQESQDGTWTLYSLCLPTPSVLYQDMLQVAQAHRPNSPSTYAYLLSEAHLIARAGLHQRLWQWTMGEKVQKEELQKLKDMYRESCALLGDYYVQCEEKSNWKQASPYYRMSGLAIGEVVTRVLNLEKHVIGGVIHYLKSVIMDHRQEPLPTPVANMVVELFGEHASEELAGLVLNSSSLRDCKVDRILQAMRSQLSTQNSTAPKDALALILLYLQKGSVDQARNMMNSLSSSQLTAILKEHHELLVEVPPTGQVAFSDLASLVKDVRPDIFVEVMVALVEAEVVALSVVLLMFLDSLPLLAGESAAGVNGSRLLRTFLEVYFSRWCAAEHREQHKINPEHNQALQVLVRANLAALYAHANPVGSEARVELFGERPDFLNSLPPFEDGTNETTNQKEKDYQLAILTKLQSLLCSPFITKDCLNTVLQFLEANPKICGNLSLRVLCSPPKEAVMLLLHHYPQVLGEYAKEMIHTEEEWKIVIQMLQNWINEAENRDNKLICLRTQRSLLHHLAQNVSPESLAHSLPSADSPDFSPYVRQCRQVQQANQMRMLIMTTGQQLLESLNL